MQKENGNLNSTGKLGHIVTSESVTYSAELMPMNRPLSESELIDYDLTKEERKRCPHFSNCFTRFLTGFFYPFRSLLFTTQHVLCRFMILDLGIFFIYIILILILGVLLGFLVSYLVILNPNIQTDPFKPYQLFILVGCVAGVFFSILGFFVTYCCTQLYFGIVFRRLSNITEQVMKGTKNTLPLYYCPQSGRSFSWFKCGKSIIIFFVCYGLKYLLHKVLVIILGCVVTPVPIIGQICLFLLLVMEFGYSNLSSVFSRRKVNYLKSLSWTFRNWDLVFGMGLGSFLLYSIFPLNLFYFFFSDVAGTMMYVHFSWREKERMKEKENWDGKLNDMAIGSETTPLLRRQMRNSQKMDFKVEKEDLEKSRKLREILVGSEEETSDDVLKEDVGEESSEPKSQEEDFYSMTSSSDAKGGTRVDRQARSGKARDVGRTESAENGVLFRSSSGYGSMDAKDLKDPNNQENSEDDEEDVLVEDKNLDDFKTPENTSSEEDDSDTDFNTPIQQKFDSLKFVEDDGRYYCSVESCFHNNLKSPSSTSVAKGFDREDLLFHHILTTHPELKNQLTRKQIRMGEKFSRTDGLISSTDDLKALNKPLKKIVSNGSGFEDYTFDEDMLEDLRRSEEQEDVKGLANQVVLSQEDLNILEDLKNDEKEEIKEEEESLVNNLLSQEDLEILEELKNSEEKKNEESLEVEKPTKKHQVQPSVMELMNFVDSFADDDHLQIENEVKKEIKEKEKENQKHHHTSQTLDLLKFVDSMEQINKNESETETNEDTTTNSEEENSNSENSEKSEDEKEKKEGKGDEFDGIDFGGFDDGTLDFDNLKNLLEEDSKNQQDEEDESEEEVV